MTSKDFTLTHPDILADILAAHSRGGGRPLVVGVCGSQGSGKSTLACALKEELVEGHGHPVAVLSLDDLYLSSRQREALSRDVHPLLRTRGVPGTHDVDLGIRVIQSLLAAAPDDTTALPRFDKAIDDPHPVAAWEPFTGRADIIIFEGWCVGAVPQAAEALVEPVNPLERDEDQAGQWRRYVNDQLGGPYRKLFGFLDRLLMLRAPAFEVVFEWRREQEQALAARAAAAGTSQSALMADLELRRFIMHYERLTRHILTEMPLRADLTVLLDERRQIVELQKRPGPV